MGEIGSDTIQAFGMAGTSVAAGVPVGVNKLRTT